MKNLPFPVMKQIQKEIHTHYVNSIGKTLNNGRAHKLPEMKFQTNEDQTLAF